MHLNCLEKPTVGSLFSGIGGIDLGFERAGWQIAWQVEKDPFCSRVLAKHWPEVDRYEDIRDFPPANIFRPVIIVGGFPCQDISQANPSGKGLQGSRSGLWFEFYRIICEIEPRWIMVENVRRLLSINDGRDFGTILGDLARQGYHATWRLLSASDFGAPHRRARVFLVANRDGERIEGLWNEPISRQPAFSWCQNVRGPSDFRNRPDIPEPLIRRNSNGISARLDSIGNAVVPQVAEWIGRQILDAALVH